MSSSRHDIRVVVFDLGGVLVDDMHNQMLKDFLYEKNAKLFPMNNNYSGGNEIQKNQNPPRSEDLELDSVVSKEFAVVHEIGERLMLQWKEGRGNIDEDLFWSKIIEESGPILQGHATVQLFKDRLRRNHMRLFLSSCNIARRISARGYRIAILSNHTKEWTEYLFSRFSFMFSASPFSAHHHHESSDFAPPTTYSPVFDEPMLQVVSCHPDIACSKPSREIYEKLMTRITSARELGDCEPRHVLFIDDKMRNVAAARDFGLNAFCFDARKAGEKTLVRMLAEYGVDAACLCDEEEQKMQKRPQN